MKFVIMNTKKYVPWLVGLMIIAPFIYGAINSNFAVLTVAFLSVLSTIIIYSTTHADEINIGILILPLIGLSFAGQGWYMPKFKQNYFVGFRLPWTLENETNCLFISII